METKRETPGRALRKRGVKVLPAWLSRSLEFVNALAGATIKDEYQLTG
jgi:hypothetical protein